MLIYVKICSMVLEKKILSINTCQCIFTVLILHALKEANNSVGVGGTCIGACFPYLNTGGCKGTTYLHV